MSRKNKWIKLKCLDNGRFDVRIISREQMTQHLLSHQTCLNYIASSGGRLMAATTAAAAAISIVVASIKVVRINLFFRLVRWELFAQHDTHKFDWALVQTIKRLSIHIKQMALSRWAQRQPPFTIHLRVNLKSPLFARVLCAADISECSCCLSILIWWICIKWMATVAFASFSQNSAIRHIRKQLNH